jgi:hypothetical protein
MPVVEAFENQQVEPVMAALESDDALVRRSAAATLLHWPGGLDGLDPQVRGELLRKLKQLQAGLPQQTLDPSLLKLQRELSK